MDAEGFRTWLTSTYESPRTGRALLPRPAGDAASRCGRVERCLRVDLDRELHSLSDPERLVARVAAAAERFRIDGVQADGIASIQSAVRLYAAYLRYQHGR